MSVPRHIPGDDVVATDTLGETAVTIDPVDGTGTPPVASWTDVRLADVYAARERIMPFLLRTPLMRSTTLGAMTGTDLWLKLETFQKTGSYKARGALNAVLAMTPAERVNGLVALSAGNHGQGLAFAARQVGASATIFVPKTAVPTKVEAMRNYGADVRFVPDMASVLPFIDTFQRETGAFFVSPYDDVNVIAGQGVIGLEILEDLPHAANVIVPIGGGGLIAGLLVALKEQRPDLRVVGVEPERANVMRRSLDAGHAVLAELIDTIADGLAAPKAGDRSFAIVEHYVDDLVLITEEDITKALWLILERTKVLVEPAGAAATAALLAGKCGVAPGSTTVAICSGGNIDAAGLHRILNVV